MSAPVFTDKVRLTADIPLAEVTALKELAARQGITITEALRRAIATHGFLQERQSTGSKVLLERNGDMTEVVFPR